MHFAYAPTRVTAPAEKPVTVEEAMLYCRVDDQNEAAVIDRFIGAATDHLDGYAGKLGRCLVDQNWALTFDRFCTMHRLPFPAREIVSITYVDAAGVSRTVSSGAYSLHRDALGSFVRVRPGQVWPAVTDQSEAIKITFTAGYGGAEDVPDGIKTAIMMIVSEVYEASKGEADSVPQITLSGVMKWFLGDHALKTL